MFVRIFRYSTICVLFVLSSVLSKETNNILNTKKLLYTVDKNFLSFIVDLKSVLTHLHTLESPSTVNIARQLSPSYVKIVGLFPKDNPTFILTADAWVMLNMWFGQSSLTPIFVLDGNCDFKHASNRDMLHEYFDLILRYNYTCFWELHYDCSGKSVDMKEKMTEFKTNVLQNIPNAKSNFKIVNSNAFQCLWSENQKTLGQILSDEQNAVAYEEHFPEKEIVTNNHSKVSVPVWAVIGNNDLEMFEDALGWTKQLQDAAKVGYALVFKHIDITKFYSNTPMYWITLLHKMLVGSKVLEIRNSARSFGFFGSTVYAHCANSRNHYAQAGEVTLIVLNDASQNYTLNLRLTPPHPKNVPLQTYLLTSENGKDVSLNEELLTFTNNTSSEFSLIPKISIVRTNNHVLSISLPPKSLGFYILGIKTSICFEKNQQTSSKKLVDVVGNAKKHVIGKNKPKISLEQELGTPNKSLEVKVVFKERSVNEEKNTKTVELELTDDEIKSILLSRARQNFEEKDKDLRTKRDINMQLIHMSSLLQSDQPVLQHEDLNNAQSKPTQSELRNLQHFEGTDERVQFMMQENKPKTPVEDNLKTHPAEFQDPNSNSGYTTTSKPQDIKEDAIQSNFDNQKQQRRKRDISNIKNGNARLNTLLENDAKTIKQLRLDRKDLVRQIRNLRKRIYVNVKKSPTEETVEVKTKRNKRTNNIDVESRKTKRLEKRDKMRFGQFRRLAKSRNGDSSMRNGPFGKLKHRKVKRNADKYFYSIDDNVIVDATNSNNDNIENVVEENNERTEENVESSSTVSTDYVEELSTTDVLRTTTLSLDVNGSIKTDDTDGTKNEQRSGLDEVLGSIVKNVKSFFKAAYEKVKSLNRYFN